MDQRGIVKFDIVIDIARKTERLLLALGSDPHSVAASLIAAGVRGQRFDAFDCPIHNYLQSNGLPVDVAGPTTIFFRSPEGERVRVETPKAVAKFMRMFDGSDVPDVDALWPELVRPLP